MIHDIAVDIADLLTTSIAEFSSPYDTGWAAEVAMFIRHEKEHIGEDLKVYVSPIYEDTARFAEESQDRAGSCIELDFSVVILKNLTTQEPLQYQEIIGLTEIVGLVTFAEEVGLFLDTNRILPDRRVIRDLVALPLVDRDLIRSHRLFWSVWRLTVYA